VAGRRATRAGLAQRLKLDPALPWLATVAMMRGDVETRVLSPAGRRAGALPRSTVSAPGRRGRAGTRSGDRRTGADQGAGAISGSSRGSARWPELLAASDLYVWPAIGEAYGLAILEAQAAGLPVVAGETGGVGDIVAHGVTGLLGAGGRCRCVLRRDRRADRRLDPTRAHGPCRAAQGRRRPRPRLCGAAARRGAARSRTGERAMTLLALLRHGPTAWTRQHRLQGRADLPLDAAGRRDGPRLAPAVGASRFPLAHEPTCALHRDRGVARPRDRDQAMPHRDGLGPLGRPDRRGVAGGPGRGDDGSGGMRARLAASRGREPARGAAAPGAAVGRDRRHGKTHRRHRASRA